MSEITHICRDCIFNKNDKCKAKFCEKKETLCKYYIIAEDGVCGANSEVGSKYPCSKYQETNCLWAYKAKLNKAKELLKNAREFILDASGSWETGLGHDTKEQIDRFLKE